MALADIPFLLRPAGAYVGASFAIDYTNFDLNDMK